MSALKINPFEYFTDSDGAPLDAGLIYIGVANLDPETNPISVYYDAALTIPVSQPIRTVNGYVLNSGIPASLFVGSNYSVRVRNKNAAQVYYVPDFYAKGMDGQVAALYAAANGATLVGYGAKTVAGELDILSDLYVIANDTQFGGIDPTGTTDSTVNMAAAMAYAASVNKPLVFKAGTYLVNPLRLSAAYPTSSTCAFELLSNLHIEGYGDVVFKIKDNSSTDASIKRFTMFYTAGVVSNFGFKNITFDGNWLNNKISPNRASLVFTAYNQAFIGVFGNTAVASQVSIDNCIFKNNAGQNNIICSVPQGVVANPLGTDWRITNTTHIDGGMDTGDFTAIFGWVDNCDVSHNLFKQTTPLTVWNGAGARNAFEVHGSCANFSHNVINNYVNGVIVNSNYTNTVKTVTVCNNLMTNMFLGGIRLWRQTSSPLNQTYITGVVIEGNVIELNDDLYSTASVVKAGIWGASNIDLAIDNVSIRGNIVGTQSPMPNLSACVYLQTSGALNTEVYNNYDISNNVSEGTYYGVFVRSLTTAPKFGVVRIENNQCLNLTSVGAFASPIGIQVRGDNSIAQAIVFGNYTSSAAGNGNGINLQNNITRLHTGNNQSVNFLTSYVETTLNVGFRSGESPQLTFQNTTLVTQVAQMVSSRKTVKVTIPYSALAGFAALSAQLAIATIPARARVVSVIADTTTGFSGGAIATITASVGRSASGVQFIATHSVAAAGTKGLIDADMGTELTRAAAVQGGAIASWTIATNVYVSFVSTGANLNAATAGSLDLYFTLDLMGN
jgi:hypothetical protein